MPQKRPKRRKKITRRKKKVQSKKALHGKKAAGRKGPSRRKKIIGRKKPARGQSQSSGIAALEPKGLGADSGGQSGDVQGLSNVAAVDSESVEELAEEGQAFEAEVISGVENAPDADTAEVTTKEVPEDDVPPEYRERE